MGKKKSGKAPASKVKVLGTNALSFTGSTPLRAILRAERDLLSIFLLKIRPRTSLQSVTIRKDGKVWSATREQIKNTGFIEDDFELYIVEVVCTTKDAKVGGLQTVTVTINNDPTSNMDVPVLIYP